MPSIDLASLRQQGAELADRIGDPPAFRTALRSLLDRHSHRLLRRGKSMVRRSALPAWEVPGLLIREVEAALLPAARQNPDAALQAAVGIWPSGRLEEKRLAAFLAGLSEDTGEIRTVLLRWLADTEDPEVLEDLARLTCRPLRSANGVFFRSDVRAWITDPHPARRRFGWTALHRWVEDKNSESFFAAFELLPLVFDETDPEAAQSAVGLFGCLADYSPQETEAWLSEMPSKARQHGRRFLRSAISILPGETADHLRALLREA
jgi:hypothetical protein